MFTFLTGTYVTKPPEFIVFKPGYCSWFNIHGIEVCMKKMKSYDYTNSNNIGEIVELPKLTKREDRLRIHLGPKGNNEDWKKQREFIRLLNEERRYLGWPEYEIIEGVGE